MVDQMRNKRNEFHKKNRKNGFQVNSEWEHFIYYNIFIWIEIQERIEKGKSTH